MQTTTEQLRRELWADLQGRLAGDRRRVYDGFLMWGPTTTQALAERIGMSLLTVRPRTTELLQAGLVELTGRDGHDGVYMSVRVEDVVRRAVEKQRPQQMLML